MAIMLTLFLLCLMQATCHFFRQPANFAPDFTLSLSELAALDMCQKRAIFKPMNTEERENLKQRCGGSWKLVLRYLLAGEACSRREKSQAIAGPGHSIAVTSKGAVYSFGSNSSGQLGHGTTDEEWRPRPIRLELLGTCGYPLYPYSLSLNLRTRLGANQKHLLELIWCFS